MSDNYQPIYDAVRSRLSNCDVGRAVENAVQVEIACVSQQISYLASRFDAAISDMQMPHVSMRPKLSIDGDKWCALYGEDLQNGVAGFGDSPLAAMQDFDMAFYKELPKSDSKEAGL